MNDKKNAVSEEELRHELARAVRRSLLPQAFPLRREIEFAAALDDSAAGTCYYDTFWLDPYTVGAAVLHLAAESLEGAMAAAALKQVFRATLVKSRDPATALETCRRVVTLGDISAAAIVVDLSAGTAVTAAAGNGRLFFDNGTVVPPGALSVAQGTALRLGIGDFCDMPAATGTSTTAVSVLAEQALCEMKGALAVAVVLYKRAVRPPGVETIMLANEVSEIPRVLARLGRFFNHHGIEPQNVVGIDLALDEVLTNLISYAFRDGAQHTIDVEVAVANSNLSIEVRDNGTSFNPLKIPPPALNVDLVDREVGGLGMHCVRTIADSVTYRREEGWNILRLTKRMVTSTNQGEKA